MKRFWLFFLTLLLVMAFSASVYAVDVRFSGEFYAAGMYLDKTTVKKNTSSDGPSTAFYFQRLRVQTDFVISPGLTLTTRFDAMERAWGAARTTPGTALGSLSSGTTAENENIAFDYGYVTYASPIGIIAVGYMPNDDWGTVFGNSQAPAAKITYGIPIGRLYLGAQIVKISDKSSSAKAASTRSDNDSDQYSLLAIYSKKNWSAGLLGLIGRDASGRDSSNYSYTSQYYIVEPYFTGKFGPVKLQAELLYGWGTVPKFENAPPPYWPIVPDVNVSNLEAWIDATATFGPVYVGASFAYLSGDNPDTADKNEGGLLFKGGNDWNPCLIMWNYDRTYWAGSLAGHDGTTNGSPMTNAWFFQGRGGVKPIDKLDIMASVSYAWADKKPKTAGVEYSSDKYGTEIDLTATYKITNNLSYMLGFGYWFVGDFYKGTTDLSLRDDYLLINKLTLTF